MLEQRDLGLVGRAHQRRVVAGGRHVRDIAELRVGVDGIDRGDEVLPGKAPALVPLDAEADD